VAHLYKNIAQTIEAGRCLPRYFCIYASQRIDILKIYY
jgi:hypothetical protein